MKGNFSKVLFTDESRATVDGLESLSKGWVLNERDLHQRFRRQQEESIIIWAGIIDDIIVGPWKVPDRIKMTAVAYITFQKELLEPSLKKSEHLRENHLIYAR